MKKCINFVEHLFDMLNSRDYIVEKSYEQYLKYGYEGVSISVLQDTLDIGRATLYHYFNSKDDLFKEVVNKYIVSFFVKFIEIVDTKTLTIPKMIEIQQCSLSAIKQSIKSFSSEKELKLSNYTALVLYAYLNDVEFRTFMRELLKKIVTFGR